MDLNQRHLALGPLGTAGGVLSGIAIFYTALRRPFREGPALAQQASLNTDKIPTAMASWASLYSSRGRNPKDIINDVLGLPVAPPPAAAVPPVATSTPPPPPPPPTTTTTTTTITTTTTATITTTDTTMATTNVTGIDPAQSGRSHGITTTPVTPEESPQVGFNSHKVTRSTVDNATYSTYWLFNYLDRIFDATTPPQATSVKTPWDTTFALVLTILTVYLGWKGRPDAGALPDEVVTQVSMLWERWAEQREAASDRRLAALAREVTKAEAQRYAKGVSALGRMFQKELQDVRASNKALNEQLLDLALANPEDDLEARLKSLIDRHSSHQKEVTDRLARSCDLNWKQIREVEASFSENGVEGNDVLERVAALETKFSAMGEVKESIARVQRQMANLDTYSRELQQQRDAVDARLIAVEHEVSQLDQDIDVLFGRVASLEGADNERDHEDDAADDDDDADENEDDDDDSDNDDNGRGEDNDGDDSDDDDNNNDNNDTDDLALAINEELDKQLLELAGWTEDVEDAPVEESLPRDEALPASEDASGQVAPVEQALLRDESLPAPGQIPSHEHGSVDSSGEATGESGREVGALEPTSSRRSQAPVFDQSQSLQESTRGAGQSAQGASTQPAPGERIFTNNWLQPLGTNFAGTIAGGFDFTSNVNPFSGASAPAPPADAPPADTTTADIDTDASSEAAESDNAQTDKKPRRRRHRQKKRGRNRNRKS